MDKSIVVYSYKGKTTTNKNEQITNIEESKMHYGK